MSDISITAVSDIQKPGRVIIYRQSDTELTFGVMTAPQRDPTNRGFSFSLIIFGTNEATGMSAICCDQDF